MESAAEKEGTPGGGSQRVAEGARPRPAAGGEGARDLDGSPEAGDGEERNGLAGTKTTEDAEEIKMDLAVVKQEVVDWSDLDGGVADSQWVKQEVEGGPEVKDEKGVLEVKQEADSSLVVKEEEVDEPEVKEEKVKVKEEVTDWEEVKEEDLTIKQELFVGQNVKEEQVMDAAPIKEEGSLKSEAMEDVKLKEEPQVNPRVGSKRKLAMSRCETCGTEEAKYRCPRCMRYSCSLPCVKKHKADLTCNGVRDKTAYVSLQQFTEMNLLSDYRFLEDVARTADKVSRDTFLKRPKRKKYLFFMKNRARKQGIYLRLLPNGFSKRKENSTVFDHRPRDYEVVREARRLHWRSHGETEHASQRGAYVHNPWQRPVLSCVSEAPAQHWCDRKRESSTGLSEETFVSNTQVKVQADIMSMWFSNSQKYFSKAQTKLDVAAQVLIPAFGRKSHVDLCV